MRCQDISTKSVDYLAGSLGESERHEFEGHLESCPACQAEWAGLSQTWAQLGTVRAMEPDTAVMRKRFDAILAAAESTQTKPTVVNAGPRTADASRNRFAQWLREHVSVTPMVQACAALLLVLLGVQLGRETRPALPTTSAPDVRQLSQEVRDLRQMVTLSLMQQESAAERLKGVSWSNQLQSPGNEVVAALIDTLMHDSNVNVRLASIDALKRFSERDVVRSATLQALDTQTSPLVQMALIDFVVETRDRQAIDALRRLSGDDKIDATVRARAKWGIGHLASSPT